MKTIIFILVLCPCLIFAADVKLRDGTVYRQAEVTGVEIDGVRVMHADGVTKVPFESLPADLQTKYHYDAAKLAAYRKSIADAAAAAQRKKDDEERQLVAAAQQANEEKQAANEKRAEKESKNVAARVSAALREDWMGKLAICGFAVLFIAYGVLFYFLPTIWARRFRKKNLGIIFLLNVCLAWFLPGWAGLVIWAFIADAKEEAQPVVRV